VACGHTGFQGRTGIFELLSVDDALRERIHNRAAEAELLSAAKRQGMTSLREDGERLVVQGITSAQELLRVTRE
jgi:general secretion pathway protein E